jgi:hypothetical protein
VRSRSSAGQSQPGDHSATRRSISAKSSCASAVSAIACWKKKMYQERRACDALVVKARNNAGPYGTAAVTIFRRRAGARSAAK